MKLSILTMVTKPEERQDKWWEALMNYNDLADEVIVVNGGPELKFNHSIYPKIREVFLPWKDDWEYPELPKHLNFGKSFCTGDWILKLDIDHFVHESQFRVLRNIITETDDGIDLLKMRKINFSVNMKYYAKGSQPIIFRNKPNIGFGFIEDFPDGDLCIPMEVTDSTSEVWVGKTLRAENTEICYWNFSYTFKTEAVAKAHYLRMAKAFRNYFNSSKMGNDDEGSWQNFLIGMQSKIEKSNQKATFYEIPGALRHTIQNLKPEEKGYNFWGRIKI